MPITALPKSTARAIGSTSVISDPCSIVKELLDNALDASATSVGIEVSQNTLDLIQAKDNGHGIPSEDHAFVCRRTFTSKIQTLDDLRRVGGKSLGFRGQALASAAEISGAVNIFTRVESEPVGTSMKYGRNGDLSSTQRTSHPVGTTVRITDLFKHIPVRRQTVLKNSAKTLTRVKKMIQAYAMCNPSKRFSLKVLKARTENSNWVYAPQHGTLMDAALKIAGYGVASNCVEMNWPLQEHGLEGVQSEAFDSGFRVVSLLPKVDCDITKMNNIGQFISVDGRPVSATRGIGQDVAKLYKSYIHAAASRQDGSGTTTDPFLCLQIRCPEASYDVNIEPAKDDVLFEDPHEVLALVEELLQCMYREKDNPSDKRATQGKQATQENNSFNLLLARRDEDETVPAQENSDCRPHVVTTSSLAPHPITHTERIGRTRESSDSEGSLIVSSRSPVEGQNPWSSTRLNAPMQQRNNVKPNGAGPRITKYVPGRGFRDWSQNSRETSRRGSAASILPSPSASSPESSSRSMELPLKAARFQIPRVPKSRTPEQHRLEPEHGEQSSNGMLDTWLRRSAETTPLQASPELEEPREPSLSQLAKRRFEQSSPNENESTSQTISTAGPSGRTREGSISSEATSINHGAITPDETNNAGRTQEELPVPDGWSAGLHQLSQASINALEDALDFERRKKEAIQKRREQIRNQSANSNTKSPHHSRYLAARASLTSQPGIAQHSAEGGVDDVQWNNLTEPQTIHMSTSKPALGPFDPRSYLMRHRSSHLQGTSNGAKFRRINTLKLPFETIPTGQKMHDLGLQKPFDIWHVSEDFQRLITADKYTQSGREEEAFGVSDADSGLLETWAHRLRSLIAEKYRTEDSSAPTVQFDFTAVTQR